MKVLHKNSLVGVITLIIFSLSISNFNAIEAAGFSTDLIHRDSLQSPSFHSSYEHAEAALQRSFNRVETLMQHHSPQASTSVDIVSNGGAGEYLMRIGIGTPKVETLALIDTGSHLTWTQCKPSGPWYDRKQPHFVANRSSSYRRVACPSRICKDIPDTSCEGTNGSCSYTARYVDGTLSKGDIAVEAITLGNHVIDRVLIGCSHLTKLKASYSPDMSGVVGLGGSGESLIRQMGPSFGGKFSYCLVPQYLFPGRQTRTKPSKIHFGDEAVVSGAGVATTPFIAKPSDSFFRMSLVGMSVGNQLFDLEDPDNESSEKAQEEKMLIDSGSTLTFLPSKLYHQVEAAVRRKVIGLRQINDPRKRLSLCYAPTVDADKKIPEITVHFKGANVKLKSYNSFIMRSKKSMCLAFVPTTILPIYGNLAQANFLIGYDLVKNTLSFKPTNCSS